MTNHNKSGYQSHLDELGIEFDTSDIGNADRFQAQFKTGFKYLSEEGHWIIHDGRHWTTQNASSAVSNLGEEVMRRIYDEARDCKNDQGRYHLTNHARRSQNKGKIDPMLGLVKHRYAVSISEFDTDPELINCQNGVLNLRTGELAAHSEDQMFMKITRADYKPQAKCPQWDQFLSEITLGDKELIRYLQKALGYSLTGHTREHKLFLAYGLGSNGKTTLIETVLDLIGDYGITSEFSNFLDTDKTNVRMQEAVGMLKGVRFATASETGSTKKWNEALIKKLTGDDTLLGTKLHKESYSFRPSHKLWFQVNHLPGVKDASDGFWRRIVVIPFKKKFEGSAKTVGLKDRFLTEEREGIFAWLCEGARLYLIHGLGEAPEACLEATRAYKFDNDILSRYLNERLQDDPLGKIPLSEAHSDYEKWCFTNKESPISLGYFGKAIEERGVTKKRVQSGMIIIGKKFRKFEDQFNGVAIEAPFEDSTIESRIQKRETRTTEERLWALSDGENQESNSPC